MSVQQGRALSEPQVVERASAEVPRAFLCPSVNNKQDMKKVVLIGCGKRKLPNKSKATDLYIGDLFKKSWALAEKEFPKAKKFILSAKHHLLDPEEVIDPYDCTLSGARMNVKKEWSEIVISQLKEQRYSPDDTIFYIFAGNDYTKYLLSPLGPINNYKLMYEGYGGIGHILHHLNETLLHLTQNFKGSYLENIKDIREELDLNPSPIKTKPGVYRLWIKKKEAIRALNNLSGININRLLCTKIGDDEYVALYFGMSGNIKERLDWHIRQEHTDKTINSTLFSTPRHSIAAIMADPNEKLIDMQKKVDDFLDNNGFFEWEYLPGKSMAAYVEDEEIARNYYPLNMLDNPNMSKDLRKSLVNLRAKVR